MPGIRLDEVIVPIGPDNPGGLLAPLPGDYCGTDEDRRREAADLARELEEDI